MMAVTRLSGHSRRSLFSKNEAEMPRSPTFFAKLILSPNPLDLRTHCAHPHHQRKSSHNDAFPLDHIIAEAPEFAVDAFPALLSWGGKAIHLHNLAQVHNLLLQLAP